MATRIETVTLQIAGANPQTKTLQVVVDTDTGSGSTQFSWQGVKPGLDTISAAAVINGQSLSSNLGQFKWGIPDVQDNGSGSWENWPCANGSKYCVIAYFADGTHTGPSNVIMPLTANKTAGTYRKIWLKWNNNLPGVAYFEVYCLYIDRATVTASYGKLHGFGSKNDGIPYDDFPPGPQFPPTLSQIQLDDGEWYRWAGDGQAPPSQNTTLLAPVSSSEAGVLVVTPSGGNGNVAPYGGTATLTVRVQNFKYTKISYFPLLESKPGNIYIANNSGLGFDYPSFAGNAVDRAVAAANAFQVGASDNNGYSGLLSIGASSDKSKIQLNYNGGPAPANTISSNLIVTADDLAFSSAKGVDPFVPTSQGGGKSASVEVDYLVWPSVSKIDPASGAADGGNHTIRITLAKPMPPLQSNTTCAVSGVTVVSGPTPVMNGSWLTGWDVVVKFPLSTQSSTLSMNINISGTVTYLKGDAFATETLTYYNQAKTISLSGSTSFAPQVTAFDVWNVDQNVDALNAGLDNTTRFTCTVRASNQSFGTITFRGNAGGYACSIAANPTNVRSDGSGGYLADYSATLTRSFWDYEGAWYFTASGTMGDGQSVSYSDGNAYYGNNYSSGGGGGGYGY